MARGKDEGALEAYDYTDELRNEFSGDLKAVGIVASFQGFRRARLSPLPIQQAIQFGFNRI